MQFGSRQKRNLVSGTVLAIVPDVLIAIVAASWTDSGLLGFFAVLIGLQVLYLLIWAKNAIWNWLFFWLRGRKRMAEHLLDYLRSNAYPEPEEYQDDVQAYFQGVMDDQHVPMINMMRILGRGSLFLQTFLSYEDAIQTYTGIPSEGSCVSVKSLSSMFKKRTVFVLGAGANQEFGLPVGSELMATVSRALSFRFDTFKGQTSGDAELLRLFKRTVAAVVIWPANFRLT